MLKPQLVEFMRRMDKNSVAIIPAARESCYATLDFTCITYVEGVQFHAQRWRHGLDRSYLANPGG